MLIQFCMQNSLWRPKSSHHNAQSQSCSQLQGKSAALMLTTTSKPSSILSSMFSLSSALAQQLQISDKPPLHTDACDTCVSMLTTAKVTTTEHVSLLLDTRSEHCTYSCAHTTSLRRMFKKYHDVTGYFQDDEQPYICE